MLWFDGKVYLTVVVLLLLSSPFLQLQEDLGRKVCAFPMRIPLWLSRYILFPLLRQESDWKKNWYTTWNSFMYNSYLIMLLIPISGIVKIVIGTVTVCLQKSFFFWTDSGCTRWGFSTFFGTNRSKPVFPLLLKSHYSLDGTLY